MQYLFIHQNFPGQFKFLAPSLARRGHLVVAMKPGTGPPTLWNGVRLLPYAIERRTAANAHPWVSDFETKTIRGEACYRAALKLKAEGFTPDAIVAHPGWGESLFIKDVWPRARLGIYCEFYYAAEGLDVGFDPEFPATDPDAACRLRLKNLNNTLHFQIADAGLSPTRWQADTFPMPFRRNITVIHDGIDTTAVTPDPTAHLSLKHSRGDLVLTPESEVVTFVNRNLEPLRGYHIFMRALPHLVKQRKNAHILIVGGTNAGYGLAPPPGRTWRDLYAWEVRAQIADTDWARVHFLDNIPYAAFLRLLQVSTVHVYLTYPFVLSWSLLEAMSAGCTIVASDTPPLHEIVLPGDNGVLVDFHDAAALSEQVCRLLGERATRQHLGRNARQFAIANYDLESICLPRQFEWMNRLTH